MSAKRDQGMFNNEGASFCKPRTEPLEVIVVGLSRTGTSSMLEALQILGYGNVYSSRDMIRRHQGPFATSMLNTKLSGFGPAFGIEQFESLFGEYRAISGELVAYIAEDIIKAYPNAKVVLTVRDDEERWLRSLLDSLWYNYSTWTHWFLRRFDREWANNGNFVTLMWEKIYWGDPATHGLRVYREHNALVKRVVEPRDRLLVYSTTQGWGPLCHFLEKDVPDVDFPAVNKVEEHRALFDEVRAKYIRAWLLRNSVKGVVLPGTLMGLLWFSRQRIALGKHLLVR